MEELLKNTSTEMLREYYYDVKCCYPASELTRDEIIKIILNKK